MLLVFVWWLFELESDDYDDAQKRMGFSARPPPGEFRGELGERPASSRPRLRGERILSIAITQRKTTASGSARSGILVRIHP